MPKKKTAQKKRASLSAENLKPGVRFKYGAFYGRPSVGIEILRARESGTAASGLPQDRWWSRNLDTGAEGYVSLGPGGILNVDEVIDAERSGATPRHHATKKTPAQLQREIDEALAPHQGRWDDSIKKPHVTSPEGRLADLQRQGFMKRGPMRTWIVAVEAPSGDPSEATYVEVQGKTEAAALRAAQARKPGRKLTVRYAK
jgi:hypothetical protein